MCRQRMHSSLSDLLSKYKSIQSVGTYFGSKDNIFTLLRTQPTANVVVSEALGISVGGNRVPVQTKRY